MKYCFLLCCVLMIAACQPGAVRVPAGKPKGNQPAANTDDQQNLPAVDPIVEALRADIEAVAARPERRVGQIEVQHLLVSFREAGIGATRSKEEAEKLAAELYARIKTGEDFEALVRQHSDDPVDPEDTTPGIYGMTMSGPGDPMNNLAERAGMVPAFGNVGWRLDVGEVGVAPFDPVASKFGWHIIKRLK